MNVRALGFVTGCHAGDKFMVQAMLASIRHYCPDVPICLIVNGDFDVSDLEREYDLIVLRVSELPSRQMRKLMRWNCRAKKAAMWQAPSNITFGWIRTQFLGHRLAVVPFSAVVWGTIHGNNASGKSFRMEMLQMLLGRIRRTRLVTTGLRREFALITGNAYFMRTHRI